MKQYQPVTAASLGPGNFASGCNVMRYNATASIQKAAPIEAYSSSVAGVRDKMCPIIVEDLQTLCFHA